MSSDRQQTSDDWDAMTKTPHALTRAQVLTQFSPNVNEDGTYLGMMTTREGGWVLFEHAEELRQALAQQVQEVVKYAKEAQGYLVKIEHLADQIASLQTRLTASEAAKKWTKERPTVAGLYWHRWSDGSDEQIVKVQQDPLTRNWFCYHVGSAITYSIPRIDDRGDKGEWQGPLTPGEE